MGPCQINQPRKIKPAKRFFFPSQELTQRSISVAMPAHVSPRPSAEISGRDGKRLHKTGGCEASAFGVTLRACSQSSQNNQAFDFVNTSHLCHLGVKKMHRTRQQQDHPLWR